MDCIEIWNKVVGLFKQNQTQEEFKLQQLWENIFKELLCYKSLDNEIDTQRKIHLGSTERVIPDIILRKDNKDIAVIELKRGSVASNDKYKQQLFSYLKQLKLDIGVLITNKIQLFLYDYKKVDSEQMCVEIDFIIDSVNGQKFIELFNRNSFNIDLLKEFVEGDSKRKEELLKLKSEITENKIKEILSDYYKNNGYNALVVDEFINNVLIRVEYNKKQEQIIGGGGVHPITPSGTIGKNEAIEICKSNNVSILGAVTFANLSGINGKYPANVKPTYLGRDWTLLLNDGFNNKLHIFLIPANTFDLNDFYVRKDKNLIVLGVDNDFIDHHPQQNIENRFLKFKVKTLEYGK